MGAAEAIAVNNPKLNKIRQVFTLKINHAARGEACKDWMRLGEKIHTKIGFTTFRAHRSGDIAALNL